MKRKQGSRFATRGWWLVVLVMWEMAAVPPRAIAADDVTKILLIPTAFDHPYATHMYTQVCQLLAACLNQTPGVEAVVCPDLDWPQAPALLEGVDGIVYYSRPAGDIVLAPPHREAFLKLMNDGVGFTAIHWATACEEPVGPLYERLLGGWFNFAFCGLKVDKLPLVQAAADHPICRGWNTYDIRDEFYLNLKFDPRTVPVLTVNVDDKVQTVAWVLEREGGGRSFGSTLGHFHDNYAIPEFRRALVNGILWTVGIDVPPGGAPVDLAAEVVELPPPPRTDAKTWTAEELTPLTRRFMPVSGKELAEVATTVGGSGGLPFEVFRETDDEVPLAEWADQRLPVRQGLAMWLDASRLNAARKAEGRLQLLSGMPVGDWPDASGRGVAMRQRRRESQPLYVVDEAVGQPCVAFDGGDDLLTAAGLGVATEGFTAAMVLSVANNAGWPGLLSANAPHWNDYQSGFTIDLMSEATDTLRTLTVEGPGYQGSLNLLREAFAFGEPFVLVVVSKPGERGVEVRINGRLQESRDRLAGALAIDEVALGARHWSNDPAVPPIDRGFLRGEVSDVLLYARPLDENELIATETFLSEARQPWLAGGRPRP